MRARGIKDSRVLNAMLEVPRHYFVPSGTRGQAYEDYPLPIGEGQTNSQPYIVALMTEMLELKATDRVLEIGTGCGYQTAILSRLAQTFYSVELLASLSLKAAKVLGELGYANIELKVGDGYRGWVEHAPYDAIIVTASPPALPEFIAAQLRDGGRAVLPMGKAGEEQKLWKIVNHRNGLHFADYGGVLFVPMKPGNPGDEP